MKRRHTSILSSIFLISTAIAAIVFVPFDSVPDAENSYSADISYLSSEGDAVLERGAVLEGQFFPGGEGGFQEEYPDNDIILNDLLQDQTGDLTFESGWQSYPELT